VQSLSLKLGFHNRVIRKRFRTSILHALNISHINALKKWLPPRVSRVTVWSTLADLDGGLVFDVGRAAFLAVFVEPRLCVIDVRFCLTFSIF
jgi:hypothetical protein